MQSSGAEFARSSGHSLGYTATGFSKHPAMTDERRTYVEWLDDDVQKRTMKVFLKIIMAIVASSILALVVLSITGLDPNQRRPGLWLKGNAVSFPSEHLHRSGAKRAQF